METSHSEDHTYSPSKKNESVAIVNDVNSVSLRQALEYCIDVLKIKIILKLTEILLNM